MESILADAYGWRPCDLEHLEWAEVWEHSERAYRAKGAQLSWDLRVRVFVHAGEDDRRKTLQMIQDLQQFSWQPTLSIYDLATDAERKVLIGSAVSHEGVRWLQDHARWAAWLAEQGVSVSECLAAYEHRMRSAMTFKGWSPIRNKRYAGQHQG